MFKKILALALALLMLATVFAGCSKKKPNLGEASDTKAETKARTTFEEEDIEGESPDEDFQDEEEITEDDSEEESSEKMTLNDTNPDFTRDGEVQDTREEDDWTIEELLDPKNHEGSDIPDDRDYEGYEFKLLVDVGGGGGMAEFLPESDGDLVKDKVIERREMIEEYLGISIKTIEFRGGYANMEGYASEIEASSGAGTPYDLSSSYNLIPPIVAAKGLSRDLAESDNLNLLNTTKPYWGKEIKQEIMIGGRIFWMSDNSSWSSIRSMVCIFVNKSRFETNNEGFTVDKLYEMVDNKTWTMDNMLVLSQNAYVNSNIGDASTDGVDAGDEFGLCATFGNATIDTWLYAAGFRSTRLNPVKGTYDWIYGDPSVISFIDDWQEKLLDDDVIRGGGAYFGESGRAIFMYGPVSTCEAALEYEYTVLPAPFYSANVKNNYSTVCCNVYSSYLIPKAAKSEAFERSATVLELIAAGGNQYIAPAYFEVFLKRQQAGMDRDMFRMFNIIRNSQVFDIGYLYGSVLTYERPNGAFEEPFIALRRIWVGDGTGFYSNMSSVWASIGSSITVKLNNLMVDILDY